MSTADVLTDPTPLVWTDAEFDRMVARGILPANHSRVDVRFTRDQYRTLAEYGFFIGRRVLLMAGEVLEMAAMKEPHASGVSGVVDTLRTVFGVGFYVRAQMPLDVNTGHDPEPDVTVVPGTRKTYSRAATAPAASLALLVVEVSDTTLYYDTTSKAELYATAGIADYWVLDVVSDRLLVFRDPHPLGGTVAYRTCLALSAADTVTPLAVPTTPISVADLLP